MYTNFTHADQLGMLFSEITHYHYAWAKKQGISYNQLAVLHSLVHLEQCTQKQIAQNWAIPKQTISTICKHYIQTGIIADSAGDDKREKLMQLTEKGESYAKAIIERFDDAERQVFDEFGIERSEALLQELQAISHLFAKYLVGETSGK